MGRLVRLEMQNEVLLAIEDGEALAVAPDVISVIGTDSGEPVPTESLRFGHRVALVACASPSIWTTPEGLDLVGPEAFGLSVPYTPITTTRLAAHVAELHLGVDVGGTDTDAVILDQSGTLLARAKVSTRPDIRSGIERAVDIVLAAPGVEARRVRRVMVGTTHAANAILQRRALQKVAVIRLGAPLTMAVPPLSTWPADLRAAISVGEVVVAGGCDYDGEELAPLDREEIARFVSTRAGACDAVAITGVFSPVSPGQLEAAGIVHRELGDVEICLSHQIGTVGLVERENATVLNASLIGFAGRRPWLGGRADQPRAQRGHVLRTERRTLMALEFALSFPVLTIASGPAEQYERSRIPQWSRRRHRGRRRRVYGGHRRAGPGFPTRVVYGQARRGRH